MSVIHAAIVVLKVAVAVSRHPITRTGIVVLSQNPATRNLAIGVVRNVAYGAGVVAGKVVRSVAERADRKPEVVNRMSQRSRVQRVASSTK